MSKIEVDKIIPQSGTTLTIGDSGDTITVASGATLTGDLNADNLTSGTVPDARITGAYTGITNLTITGDLTVDTNTLKVDSTNNRVGIGTSSPDNLLHIEGDQPTYKLTSTNPLSTSVGTETISDIDFEGQNNNLYRTTARIRARQDGTWSTGTANFAPTALDFFTQDNSTSDAMTSPRMTINEDGYVIIPAGVTLGTSAGTYNASNTLDDYEEGTWTPTVSGGLTGFTVQQAKYTKIGQIVNISMYANALTGASASRVDIGGLPFTSATNLFGTGVVLSGAGKVGVIRVQNSSTTSRLYYANASTGNRDDLTGTLLGTHIILSVTYTVA